jgi:hypothetical protein
MCRCGNEKMICADVKMYNRPPLLEESFGQTLSGKNILEATYLVNLD